MCQPWMDSRYPKSFYSPSYFSSRKNIWTGCFIHIIRFLVIILSSVVTNICYGSTSRLLRQVPNQVMNSFVVPALAFFPCFVQVFCSWFVQLFARNLFNFFDRVNCFARIHTIILLIFLVINLTVLPIIFPATIFFYHGITLSLFTVMVATFSKYEVLCSRHVSHSFLTLSI